MEIWTGILIHLICLSGLKQQKVMLMFVLLEITSSLGAGGSSRDSRREAIRLISFFCIQLIEIMDVSVLVVI